LLVAGARSIAIASVTAKVNEKSARTGAKASMPVKKSGGGGPTARDALVKEKHVHKRAKSVRRRKLSNQPTKSTDDEFEEEEGAQSDSDSVDSLTGKSAYRPVRNRVRDRLPLQDQMGRAVTRPAYFGVKLRRTRLPVRARGHIDVPIKVTAGLDDVLDKGFRAAAELDIAVPARHGHRDGSADSLSDGGSTGSAGRGALRRLPSAKVVLGVTRPDPATRVVSDALLRRPHSKMTDADAELLSRACCVCVCPAACDVAVVREARNACWCDAVRCPAT
jgi:hypothetical protein